MQWTRACSFPYLAAALIGAGCALVTVTLLINLDVEGTHHSTQSNVGAVAVDLTADPDFADNQDKIQSVDEAGFVFRVRNNIAVPANGEIWLSRSEVIPATAATIRDGGQAKRVVAGLALPASGELHVTYEQSLSMQEHRAFLHETIRSGRFFLYGIADTATFDVTIDELTVVVVLTAGD